MMILLKLFLAHIIGDFFLQPETWVKEKEKRKLKSPKLYIHIIIHVLLLFVLLWDISFWPLIVTIGILHFLIDSIKLLFQKKKTKRLWFFIDQILHIASIIAAYIVLVENTIEASENI